jgi:hypothetical protein
LKTLFPAVAVTREPGIGFPVPGVVFARSGKLNRQDAKFAKFPEVWKERTAEKGME